MKKAAIPRKSASLFVFRRSRACKGTDYEFLLLKRKGNMSFAKALAPPGGVLEARDFDLLKMLSSAERTPGSKLEEEIFMVKRITALRETFEETGLFFLNPTKFGPSPPSSHQTIFRIMTALLTTDPQPSFQTLLSAFGLPLPQLTPIARIITIQQSPKRYDTVFFAVFLNNPDILALNVNGFLLDPTQSSLLDLESLSINLAESDAFSWGSPVQCLEDYHAQKLELAPPQLHQFHHFRGFPSLELLQGFYSKEFRGDPSARNELIRRPFYFPVVFALRKGNAPNEFFWLLPGDKDYPYSQVPQNEESEELRAELEAKFATLAWARPQLARVHMGVDQNKRLFVKAVIDQKDFLSFAEGYRRLPELLSPRL